MAIKVNGRYFSGLIRLAGEPMEYGEELTDVRDDGRYEKMDCSYCYTDDVQPVSSYEKFSDMPDYPEHVQALCPLCGAGLTPTEPSETD